MSRRSILAFGGILAAAALLAGIVLFLRRAPAGGGSEGPERRDIARAVGLDLPGTVDAGSGRRMDALRDAARAEASPAQLTVDYPQDQSIVPPELPPPTFLWHDGSAQADAWLAEVAFEGGTERIDVLLRGEPPPQGEIDKRCISERNEIYKPTPYQASARSWKPDPVLWKALKEKAASSPATISFYGFRNAEPSRVLSRGQVRLATSRDPVGAPIFYRDVPLMPSQTEEGVIKPLAKGALPLIIWRLRDVGQTESRAMLTDMPTCANCHSFSNDGRTMGMDVDGPQGDRGAYALVPIASRVSIGYKDVLTWNAFPGKPKDFMTIGFLSRVSPDGQHVISTVNESLYVQNFWNYKINQVFYPTRGILAVFDRETRAISALPGADDPESVHCDPIWTPDGKTIVFARARARDAYITGRPAATYAGDPNETPIQYDLYRVPFEDGRGGVPEPIEGAGRNGMSNSFPKVSPDGRFIVYVQAKNGQLLRPDSKLYIVPFEGGTPRLMRANLPLMNSWHSFSPNGRWLVFTSKSNTPYTQMFLTHIDAEGNDSPAILIENSTAANRAVNLPEFVAAPYDQFNGIDVPAVEHTRHFNRGTDLALKGDHEEAVREFRTALGTEPNDWKTSEWRIRESLSKSLLMLGRHQEALEQITESLRLNPYNGEMHANLAAFLYEAGDRERAFQHLDLAIRLMPKSALPLYNRATMRLKGGDRAGAMADYGEAIRLDPNDPQSWYGRGLAKADAGDSGGALQDLTEALRVAPADWPRRSDAEARRRQLQLSLSGSGQRGR
jgi:tetratricopeptide (TPR) repeat protein